MGDVVDQLRDAGLGPGDLVGLAVAGDRATMAVADRDAHLVIGAWARLQDLPLDTLPTTQPFDLFSHADWTAQDPDDPLGPDGHLNPGWLDAAGPRHPPGCRPGPRWPGRPRTASRSR